MGLCGHVAETLDALLPRIESRGNDRAFLDECLAAHQTASNHLQAYVQHGGSDGKLRPEQVGDAVSRLCSSDAIFTCDTGMSCVWAAQHLRLQRGQRFTTSFNHGTMANATPDQLAAADESANMLKMVESMPMGQFARFPGVEIPDDVLGRLIALSVAESAG